MPPYAHSKTRFGSPAAEARISTATILGRDLFLVAAAAIGWLYALALLIGPGVDPGAVAVGVSIVMLVLGAGGSPILSLVIYGLSAALILERSHPAREVLRHGEAERAHAEHGERGAARGLSQDRGWLAVK